MRKVKAILRTFLHSFIPQDAYYPKLIHTRFLFSLHYYLIFITVLSVLFMGILFTQYSPLQIIEYKNAIVDSLSHFPTDAIIRIKGGRLESNQDRPLFLWVNYRQQPFFVSMFDREEEFSKPHHSPFPLVLFGKDQVLFTYREVNHMFTYPRQYEFLLAYEQVHSLVTYSRSWFPTLLFITYISLFFTLPLTFAIVSTLLIFCTATVVFMLLHPFIPHMHWKKSLQAGLHGTHIPLCIVLLLIMIHVPFLIILSIHGALMFVFHLVATYEMYSKEIPQIKGR